MRENRKYVANRIKFTDEYLNLVLEGKKHSTIRSGYIFVNDIYIPLVSKTRSFKARITKINYNKKYGDLNEEDAKEDGFNSLKDLKEALKQFYPKISRNDPVTIIHFIVERNK